MSIGLPAPDARCPNDYGSPMPGGRKERMFRSPVLFCCALLAACSGSSEEPPTAGAELTDTIVAVHPDGRIEQVTHVVTADQRQFETDQRSETAEAPKTDPGSRVSALTSNLTCASADLWIYDASRDNRLCVSGASLGPYSEGWLDLRFVNYGLACLAIDIYGRCTQRAKWAGRVARVLPGTNGGRFYADTYDVSPS